MSKVYTTTKTDVTHFINSWLTSPTDGYFIYLTPRDSWSFVQNAVFLCFVFWRQCGVGRHGFGLSLLSNFFSYTSSPQFYFSRGPAIERNRLQIFNQSKLAHPPCWSTPPEHRIQPSLTVTYVTCDSWGISTQKQQSEKWHAFTCTFWHRCLPFWLCIYLFQQMTFCHMSFCWKECVNGTYCSCSSKFPQPRFQDGPQSPERGGIDPLIIRLAARWNGASAANEDTVEKNLFCWTRAQYWSAARPEGHGNKRVENTLLNFTWKRKIPPYDTAATNVSVFTLWAS